MDALTTNIENINIPSTDIAIEKWKFIFKYYVFLNWKYPRNSTPYALEKLVQRNFFIERSFFSIFLVAISGIFIPAFYQQFMDFSST
jgi:hypothetical protein